MLDRLSDPDLYSAAAERVRTRSLRASDTRPLCVGGPQLAAMGGKLDSLARQLAREVSRGAYQFGPVLRRLARIEGKERALYVASPLDSIVLGALAQVLAELFEPGLSQHLYSYRRGRSPLTAIRGFVDYIREHRRARADPRMRGLYVLRRDVRSYGDAIAAGPDSVLWSQLRDALREAHVEPSTRLMDWLQAAFRPELQEAATRTRPERGIPTGSPLQPVACNLYLGPIDRLCAAVPGAFYARYGDDMLFAHPDPACALRVMQAMDDAIADLGLTLSRDKSSAYYVTGAGRASAQAPFRGVSWLDYLGVRVEFRGVVGLKRDKLHALLGDVRARLRNGQRLLEANDEATRVRTLCAIANRTLDATQSLAHPAAQTLRDVIDDRSQLRDIDYKVTRLVAETLSGERSVRALRAYSPRMLREQAGLRSLVRASDRAKRQRA